MRRWAAGLLILAGLVNIVSAFLGPSLEHLQRIEDAIPLRFPRAASVLAVLIGVALIGLARGVRRGYQPAWATVVVLLGVTSFVMIFKGIDIEEGVLSALLALWLLFVHKHFRVLPPGHRRWAAWAVAFALGAVGRGGRAGGAVRPARSGSGGWLRRSASASWCCSAWYATRAARAALSTNADDAEALARGREIVERFGGDTLDYFALRDDKEPAVLRRRPRGLHGARPHDAGVARPDLSARGAQRRVGRRPWITPT